MRIRWRLTLFGASVTTVALIVFAILLNGIVVAGVSEDQDGLLSEMATASAAEFEALDVAALESANALVVTDPEVSDQAFLIAAAPDGSIVYSEAPPDIRIPAAVIVETLEVGRSEATADGLRYQATGFVHPDGTRAVIAAVQPVRVADENLAGFRAFLVIFGIVTVIAATVVSWLVTGRAMRPLKTLASTADEIASTGDLSRRLPPVRTNDEVGMLTRSFNGMLERLESAQAELRRTIDSQRRFVADASHELRTPLTTIRSNAGFLSDRGDADPADRGAALADIEAEAERMSRLVNDLLLLARSDAGELIATEPLALSSVVEEVVRQARHLGRDIDVEIGGPMAILGDGDAVTQLMWVLLDNAVKHGEGRIEVSARPDETVAVLTVIDNGPGIHLEDTESIFERFRQGNGPRTSSGAGLGLAIAKSIVDAHQGTITASNGPDGGAKLEVRLPLI